MFETVRLIDIKNDSFTQLIGEYKFFSGNESENVGLHDQLGLIAEKRIRPDEKDAFIAFTDCSSLLERAGNSEQGYISAVFHVKQNDGSYKLEEIVLMPIPGSGGAEFLFCSKFYPEMR